MRQINSYPHARWTIAKTAMSVTTGDAFVVDSIANTWVGVLPIDA